MTRDGYWTICPYCGYQHGDCWEWNASESTRNFTCNGCEREFKTWAEYSVEYVAQGIETRRAETSEAQAPSQGDESPVAKGDAP